MWTIYHDADDAAKNPDNHYGQFATWHEARAYCLRHLTFTHQYHIIVR